jgi:hypothetical protein
MYNLLIGMFFGVIVLLFLSRSNKNSVSNKKKIDYPLNKIESIKN